MGVVPVKFPVRDAPTIQDAIDRFARDRNGGLVLPVDVTTIVYRELLRGIGCPLSTRSAGT
jgi:hypothetical protein